MSMPFYPKSDHLKSADSKRSPFRPIPLRMLVPHVITLLAICAGFTAIRLSTQGRLGVPLARIALAALLVAFLMVSRLPVFSGKTMSTRVPPEMVLPVFVVVILCIALLIGYPWHFLSAGALIYLLTLPTGWMSYRRHERTAQAAAARA